MIKSILVNIFSFLMRITVLIGLIIPLLIIGLIILIVDLNNPIFKQLRVGKGGKLFYIYKFRTMKNDIPTKLGEVLRKTKFDELLQVINLINYSMNFIGPRPLTVEEQLKGEEVIPEFRLRLQVKSGITGYQQIKSNNPIFEQRLEYDLITINNKSILFMLLIVLRTVIPYKRT